METYELWDMRSGNLMGSFPTEREALSTLAAAIVKHGVSYADDVDLTRECGEESRSLASGQTLAKMAMRIIERTA
jgi:hypothetical protein